MPTIVRWVRVGLTLFVLVAAVAAARLFAPISTPPFEGPAGRPLAGSIAVAERWAINGVEQSVIIRGRDASKPILIWLHGGPGSSETPILRVLNGRLEDSFTVVYWDQRLAGQTLDPHAPAPASLTVEQMVADLDVLVNRLRVRLGQDKVILVGHSWGTMLGVLYATRHPEKVAAYVGIGQMADKPRAEALSYAYAVDQARRRQNGEALRQLREIGPPPYSGEEIFVQRAWLDAFGGASYADMSLPRLILMSLGSSEANWRDLYATSHGGVLGARLLERQLLSRNLDRTYLRFDVPVLIAAGRHDHLTSSTLVRDYFERVQAPAKTFVWFERSGHNPHLEEPAKFNAWLVEALRSSPP
ncbi:alpha/beta fold hydrolase [Phenylobacterium sp.]|uniref:alpha/beta fold hydrolase n=1 Tax=Phenylobacterium sp. TaxID=1871053 RepID=UPI0027359F35|nr:alpha/beta hydrolase [Phenylobacterium sp.]MDP3855121.1 alpha/beta hydrolase [Phenylobacterium sp.]